MDHGQSYSKMERRKSCPGQIELHADGGGCECNDVLAARSAWCPQTLVEVTAALLVALEGLLDLSISGISVDRAAVLLQSMSDTVPPPENLQKKRRSPTWQECPPKKAGVRPLAFSPRQPQHRLPRLLRPRLYQDGGKTLPPIPEVQPETTTTIGTANPSRP